LADGFDAVAAAAHRGNDLVDTDAEAGTDDGAGIWRIAPRAAGDEREALAQIDVFGGKLCDSPAPRDGDRLARQEKGAKQMQTVEEGEPHLARLAVGIAERFDALGNVECLATPAAPVFDRSVERQFD